MSNKPKIAATIGACLGLCGSLCTTHAPKNDVKEFLSITFTENMVLLGKKGRAS